jgi:hypothetical protein
MLDQERDYEACFDNLSEMYRIVEAPEFALLVASWKHTTKKI